MSIQTSISRDQLLAGLPILMADGTCIVHPAKLHDIAKMGVQKFYRQLNFLTLTKEEIVKLFKDKKATPFMFVLTNCSMKEDFKREFCESLRFFTREKIEFLPQLEAFLIGKFEDMRLINAENYEDFQNIIRQQHSLSTVEEEAKENSSAKRIKARLKEAREKVSKSKKDDSNVEFADLVGSLPLGNIGLNIMNVWDLSYYAFNDQFKRMRIYQEYAVSLQSLMAGADPKKVKLKDWIQNIQINKNP